MPILTEEQKGINPSSILAELKDKPGSSVSRFAKVSCLCRMQPLRAVCFNS